MSWWGHLDDSEESSDEEDLACGFNSSDDLFYDSDSMPDLECQSVSIDSEMEERSLPDHLSNVDESFDKEYIIPDIYLNLPNDPETHSELTNDLQVDASPEELEFIPNDEEAYVTTYEASELRGTLGMLPTDVDLYDLGASHHMSGFQHHFINFTKINPKPITAADKRLFSAVKRCCLGSAQ